VADSSAAFLPLFRRSGVFEWAHWEEESVLYDPASGQTHLLDAFSTEVLLALEAGPTGTEALTRHLAGLLGIDPDEALRLRVGHAVHQLQALGLVEG